MRPTLGICVLGMAHCLSVTGREAFDRLTDTLRKFALPVNNLVAFGSLRAAAALRGGKPCYLKTHSYKSTCG